MDFSSERLIIAVILFFTGAVFGSFATMASYRIPRGEDLVFKPSSCPSCKHRLGFLDLFPIFTWIFSGGKCRHCKKSVSCRYPLIEFVLASVFVLIYIKYDITLQSLALFALALLLVIMSVIDIENKIIPDSINIALVIVGFAYRYAIESDALSYFTGAFLALFVAFSLRYAFYFWKKKEGLGMGDVKFFAVAGVFLGVEGVVPFMLFSGIFGIITGIIWKKRGMGEEYPFGPSLALSLFLCVFAPENVASMLRLG